MTTLGLQARIAQQSDDALHRQRVEWARIVKMADRGYVEKAEIQKQIDAAAAEYDAAVNVAAKKLDEAIAPLRATLARLEDAFVKAPQAKTQLLRTCPHPELETEREAAFGILAEKQTLIQAMHARARTLRGEIEYADSRADGVPNMSDQMQKLRAELEEIEAELPVAEQERARLSREHDAIEAKKLLP